MEDVLDGVGAPPDLNAVRHLIRLAHVSGEKVAIEYEGENVTYSRLAELSGALASRLTHAGLKAGDRVAYAGLNSLTFFVSYFATSWMGGVFVPLNSRLTVAELDSILEDSAPEAIIAEPAHARLLDNFVAAGRSSCPIVVDDDLQAEDDPQAEYGDILSSRWELLSAQTAAATAPPVPRSEKDLAALLYTSGSTGCPKGVMLTHGNLWWNWVNTDAVLDVRPDDVCLAVAPLFHIGGLNALTLRTLALGGTVLVRRRFDAAETIKDIVTHRVTSAFVVPTMLAQMEREPSFHSANLSSMRTMIVGGAPVPRDLICRYFGRGVMIQQAWGLTETAPFVTCLPRHAAMAKRGSCGLPMPYTEVCVVDPDTLEPRNAAGTTGEMLVRGPNVTVGYWRDPDSTAAALLPSGWFRTGDLGYVDDDGYVYLVDRLGDVIVSGGENIYPAEIVNVLESHPAIRECVVIGVPDTKWGEAVCLVVSCRCPISLRGIQDYLRCRIAGYKIPSRMVKIDSIPHNGAGKVDRLAVKKLVERQDS